MIQKIDPARAVRMLDAGEALAVDVREPDEYAEGHIPGALLLPLDRIGAGASALLPDKSRALILYCRTGRRSAAAAARLKGMGYQTLYDLGGLLSWPYELEG